MTLLQVRNLTVRYGSSVVVDGVSFDLERGEAVALVGASGSGKSQTALALMGLLPSTARVSGSVRLGGTELVGAGVTTWNRFRARQIAMVFQDPLAALNPYLRVGPQLAEVLLAHRLARGAAARDRVVQMLGRVGLPDPERQYRAWPHELSGGMRQRVMIASALLCEPAVLLADEPTTALDVTVQAQVLDLLDELRQDTAMLLITHDLGIVAGRCDRVIAIEAGRLVESAPTAAFFARPGHAYSAALIAAASRQPAAPAAATQGAAALDIDGAAVSYPVRGRAALRAVRDASLTVREGETLAIVGESGAGKSSLVRAVLGLVPLDAGNVAVAGTPVRTDSGDVARGARRDLQLVFQDPAASLNPQLRVAEIVAEPLEIQGAAAADIDTRVKRSLGAVGLDDSFLSRHPHELSGGQAQRVAIARALVLEPRVLVCDEAVAALDGQVRARVLDVLRAIQARTGLAILFITHDLAVARAISHRVVVMYLGRVVEVAATTELFDRPRHPYTAALLNAVPRPDPAAPGGRATIAGEIPSLFAIPNGCAFHPRCPYTIDACRQREPGLTKLDTTLVECHRAAELELGLA